MVRCALTKVLCLIALVHAVPGFVFAQPPETVPVPTHDSVERVAGLRPTSAAALELGRKYTRLFYDGDLRSLWGQFSAALKERVGGLKGLHAFRSRLRRQAGSEKRVLDERIIPWLASGIYNRTARFSRTEIPMWVQWTIDQSGGVRGFLVMPQTLPARNLRMDYQSRAHLKLPFTGTWFVYSGGRTMLENYHAARRDQRFAYDFVIAHDGRTYTGFGRRNRDYYCFGEIISAPAAATVVAAVDEVADNVPGRPNEKRPLGNYVILSHGADEFSFLAHLQRGSIGVMRGQQVAPGQVLGRCGNSGRSSEPHLHYHLQTAPKFGGGAGLPAQFHDYLADGAPVARGEPARGTVVTARGSCGR